MHILQPVRLGVQYFRRQLTLPTNKLASKRSLTIKQTLIKSNIALIQIFIQHLSLWHSFTGGITEPKLTLDLYNILAKQYNIY